MNRQGECEYCGKFIGGRPYGGRFASVTELIKLLNFNSRDRAFGWNAAEAAAVLGVHHTADWCGMPTTIKDEPCRQDHKLCGECGQDKLKAHHLAEGTKSVWVGEDGHKFVGGLCKACTYLRSEHDRRWKKKAKLGEHVHHLAAEWARGEAIESDELVDPYLDGLEEWYKAYEPNFIEVEQTVHYKKGPREYVGTFDFLAEVNCACPLAVDCRCLALTDLKTGDFKADKDWLLQLSAYRYAQSLTRWTEGKEEVMRPMPLVSHTNVLWLRPDAHALVVEVNTTMETFNNFLRLIDLHNWEKSVDKELAELAFEGEVEAQLEALQEEDNAPV